MFFIKTLFLLLYVSTTQHVHPRTPIYCVCTCIFVYMFHS